MPFVLSENVKKLLRNYFYGKESWSIGIQSSFSFIFSAFIFRRKPSTENSIDNHFRPDITSFELINQCISYNETREHT
jgi:hypothetical protein